LAVEHKINLVGGANFTLEGGRPLNIATLFRRDGTHARQAKIHVTPGEKTSWGIAAGDAIEVLDTDKGKVAINICYDVEFPEMARVAVERGARLLFVPFCTDDRRGFLRVRYCAQARCVENQIYVVTAGVVGNLRGVPDMDVHYAQSAVLSPSDFGFARDGIAAECEANSEGVAVADVDLAALERARRTGTVRNWEDRRTDLYAVRVVK
jgi:predicted amidohydrolase